MTSIYYFSWLHGLLWLSWVVSQLQVLSLQSLTQLHSAGSLAGAKISTKTSPSGSVGVVEMAGCPAGPLSPAGFPLIHDDFIQSFISCRDVWIFAPNLSSSVKFRFHTTTEVTILKSKCFHVLNTTTSFLEPAAVLCSYFYQSLNMWHYHSCIYMSRKDSLIPLSIHRASPCPINSSCSIPIWRINGWLSILT